LRLRVSRGRGRLSVKQFLLLLVISLEPEATASPLFFYRSSIMNFVRNAARTLLLAMCLSVAGVGLWSAAGGSMAVAAKQHEKKKKPPHIPAALKDLKEAGRELKEADHDFGGHRVKAIEAIDGAIEQLEKALKFAKK